MPLNDVAPIAPAYVAFRYDGTQESIDALNAVFGDGPGVAERVDEHTWRVTNNPLMWPLTAVADKGVDDVLVLVRAAGQPVQIVADYHSVDDMAIYWTTP